MGVAVSTAVGVADGVAVGVSAGAPGVTGGEKRLDLASKRLSRLALGSQKMKGSAACRETETKIKVTSVVTYALKKIVA